MSYEHFLHHGLLLTIPHSQMFFKPLSGGIPPLFQLSIFVPLSANKIIFSCLALLWWHSLQFLLRRHTMLIPHNSLEEVLVVLLHKKNEAENPNSARVAVMG